MSFKPSALLVLIAAALMLMTNVAHAAPVAWSNSSGASTDFTWTNGANDTGNAGDPNVANGSFAFFPSLKALTILQTGSVGDIIHVTLIPNSGRRISAVSADLFGDATVIGQGSAGYGATLDAQKHGDSAHVSSTLNPPDITTQGLINDHVGLNVPNDYGTVDLFLDLNVHANGEFSLAELKVVRLNVETAAVTAVPLPAAIATFPIGAAVAGWATKRMKKRA